MHPVLAASMVHPLRHLARTLLQVLPARGVLRLIHYSLCPARAVLQPSVVVMRKAGNQSGMSHPFCRLTVHLQGCAWPPVDSSRVSPCTNNFCPLFFTGASLYTYPTLCAVPLRNCPSRLSLLLPTSSFAAHRSSRTALPSRLGTQ